MWWCFFVGMFETMKEIVESRKDFGLCSGVFLFSLVFKIVKFIYFVRLSRVVNVSSTAAVNVSNPT